ncbi:hypothetical protein AQUCO_02800282v1 [Aquilegia coerulea]|uniref:Receptor-like serine/threonine-protein kinase n=1 Tax=Aquilegia coerulea TaxID=218851 RepID=A0A2G5D4M8_AQUCA|nr:hypothetical protein AQUCO_02800282v1 [Aquilegia coerulea]
MAAGLYIFIFYSYILNLLYQEIPIAAYTLTPSQSIIDGQILISQGETFELGFFSPSNSKFRYVGIWYNTKTIPVQTVVWVANRDSPLLDTSGVLKVDTTGNVVIEDGRRKVIWSSNSSKAVESPIVEFLDSGNLVLRDKKNGDSENYMWQSFDYLCDTLLPHMKLGRDLKTGHDRFMSSWKSSDDPSYGDFTYGTYRTGLPELAIRNRSKMYYRSGPWNGIRFSGSPDLKGNSIFTYEVIQNAEEMYFRFQLVNKSVVSRFVLRQTSLHGLTWVDQTNSWFLQITIPRDPCDAYSLCGAYSSCDSNNVPVCRCLRGFKPKSAQDWEEMDWSQGCKHNTSVNCSKGEGFNRISGVKLPDTTGSWFNMTMNLDECRVKCLKNCSCMAYTNADIRGSGSGCVMWFTDLVDIRQFSNDGQDFYIRMAPSELENDVMSDTKSYSRTKKRVVLTVTVAVLVSIFLLGLGAYIFRKKQMKTITRKLPTEVNKEKSQEVPLFDTVKPITREYSSENKDDLEVLLYDFDTIATATNNFSNLNKLGEGGFGCVYKGTLKDGQQIAVKRLSKTSGQGVEEFKNEVVLIAKLQHRNLVGLYGCCVEGEEKMLVYEYMLNKSLDYHLFDKANNLLIDWQKRFNIIVGVSRGLLYLHQDSKYRIVHRDLKASNVLLDGEMNPKISDFGMARIFGGDQTEGETNRVVGTYGYMSPEYAMDGHFSAKSDVFSFGVLVLEIISGKKNRGFYCSSKQFNLLSYVSTYLWFICFTYTISIIFCPHLCIICG